MKRSPGPTPCSPLSDEQRGVGRPPPRTRRAAACARSARRAGAGRRAGRRARAACRRRVATPRIARRVVCGLSETIATLRPTMPLTSVDLPTFGRPASATKPARVVPAVALTSVSSSACSASISPSSVSWSMPVRCSAPWTTASRRSSVCVGADDDVAQLARAARSRRARRSGRTARRSARSCPRCSRVELRDPLGVDELDGDVAVLDARRRERDADEALDLGAAAAHPGRRRR